MTDKIERFFPLEHGPAFAWNAQPEQQMSAKQTDDDDDSDDEDDDDSDDEDDDDPDADKDEGELRDELKKIRASLKGTSGSDARKRAKIRKLTRELEEARKPKAKPVTKPASDSAADVDLDELRETARREGETAGITRAKKAEARLGLLGAGVSRDKITIALRNLDIDEMDLDDEGLDGIDDAIAELRVALPALFAKKRTRRESVAGDGDRDGKSSDRRKPKTASQLAADRVLGRA